jgi:hypothetical protein
MRSAGKILLLFSSLGVGAYALLAYSLTPLGSLGPSSFPRLRSSRKVGFATSSLFWLYSGTCALLAVRRGAIAEHRQWMVRNFALAFGAITLRLYLAAFIAAGIDFAAAYAMSPGCAGCQTCSWPSGSSTAPVRNSIQIKAA